MASPLSTLTDKYELGPMNWSKAFHTSMTITEHEVELSPGKAREAFPATEDDVANKIVDRLKGALTYIPGNKSWYLWNGIIHEPLPVESLPKLVVIAAKDAMKTSSDKISSFYKNLPKNEKSDDLEKQAKYFLRERNEIIKRLSTNAGINSVVELVRAKVTVSNDHFANDRQFFVLRNGVIDKNDLSVNKAVKLFPHDAKRPVYRFFDADYVPGAEAPVLRKFLSESVADAGQVRFLGKATAWALIGAPKKTKTIVSLQGATNSGKSTYNDLFHTLGGGYFSEPNRDAIQITHRDALKYRDAMKEARFLAFSEVTKKLDTAFILQYTGGDTCQSEQKFIAEKYWKPQGIMFVATNDGLQMDTMNPATFARVAPIEFPHTFSENSLTGHIADEELSDKLLDERSGIVNWILEHYLYMLDEGMDRTDSMEALKRKKRDDDSNALQYVKEMLDAGTLTFDPELPTSRSIPLAELHASYVAWCTKHAVSRAELLNQKTFRKHVQGSYEVKNSGGYKVTALQFSKVLASA